MLSRSDEFFDPERDLEVDFACELDLDLDFALALSGCGTVALDNEFDLVLDLLPNHRFIVRINGILCTNKDDQKKENKRSLCGFDVCIWTDNSQTAL